MTVLETLEKLKKLFSNPNKWTKGRLTNDRGGYCLLGGIAMLNEKSPFWSARSDNLIDKVGRAMRFEKKPYESFKRTMVIWNNSPNTTYDDLINRIDHAIQRCQSRYGHRPLPR